MKKLTETWRQKKVTSSQRSGKGVSLHQGAGTTQSHKEAVTSTSGHRFLGRLPISKTQQRAAGECTTNIKQPPFHGRENRGLLHPKSTDAAIAEEFNVSFGSSFGDMDGEMISAIDKMEKDHRTKGKQLFRNVLSPPASSFSAGIRQSPRLLAKRVSHGAKENVTPKVNGTGKKTKPSKDTLKSLSPDTPLLTVPMESPKFRSTPQDVSSATKSGIDGEAERLLVRSLFRPCATPTDSIVCPAKDTSPQVLCSDSVNTEVSVNEKKQDISVKLHTKSSKQQVNEDVPEKEKENSPEKESPIFQTAAISTGDSPAPVASIHAAAGQDSLALSSWGLLDVVLQRYSEAGITRMFDWQSECLMTGNVLAGGNLVYSAPTSAGKTMIAELLILKRVLETKKKAIVILPFVSVSREKMFYLQYLFQDAGIKVGGFMGSHSPAGGLHGVDIAVCTIEKANSLINRLLQENALDILGIVVVDELHMIGDSHRGYLLELLLTKINFVSKKFTETEPKTDGNTKTEPAHNPVQIIGMSATLPNLDMLANWLKADLYKTDFRPVPLTECVKIGQTLYDSKLMKLRDINPALKFKGDGEDIIPLCLETILDRCSVLIFCPTKNWCEKLAESIAREFYELLRNPQPLQQQQGFVKASSLTQLPIDRQAVQDVVEQLRRTPVGLDAMLGRLVAHGVAYHHAGLTFDERDIVEGAFRQGILKVLVATSTLSSGVNLPARRVIIRTPTFHGNIIDTLCYKQMVGRAGRKGVDTAGESILVCKTNERNKAVTLVKSALPPVKSCLIKHQGEHLSSSMKRAILEIVVSGVATTPGEVTAYAACTMLAASLEVEGQQNSDNVILACLKFLQENEFVRLQDVTDTDGRTEKRFYPTQLGSAVLASALSADEGLVVFAELQKARQCFVLENELHIIYQVTPVYAYDMGANIDWYNFLCMWEKLTPGMKRVAELVGVQESYLARAIRGNVQARTARQAQQAAIHRRFYTCLVLHDLVHEMPLNEVCKKYNCNRGQLQSLQQSAATFAGMVTVFCRRLGWLNLELILGQFQSRLTFGIQRELCDLVRISVLNGQRARIMFNGGYQTVAALANADPADLEHLLRSSSPFQSDKKQDGESEWEVKQRQKARCIFITGKKGVTEFEAAVAIIAEAKTLVEEDLGGVGVQWNTAQPDTPGSNRKPTRHVNSLYTSPKSAQNSSKSDSVVVVTPPNSTRSKQVVIRKAVESDNQDKIARNDSKASAREQKEPSVNSIQCRRTDKLVMEAMPSASLPDIPVLSVKSAETEKLPIRDCEFKNPNNLKLKTTCSGSLQRSASKPDHSNKKSNQISPQINSTERENDNMPVSVIAHAANVHEAVVTKDSNKMLNNTHTNRVQNTTTSDSSIGNTKNGVLVRMSMTISSDSGFDSSVSSSDILCEKVNVSGAHSRQQPQHLHKSHVCESSSKPPGHNTLPEHHVISCDDDGLLGSSELETLLTKHGSKNFLPESAVALGIGTARTDTDTCNRVLVSPALRRKPVSPKPTDPKTSRVESPDLYSVPDDFGDSFIMDTQTVQLINQNTNTAVTAGFSSTSVADICDRGNADAGECNDISCVDALPGVKQSGKGHQLAQSRQKSHSHNPLELTIQSNHNHYQVANHPETVDHQSADFHHNNLDYAHVGKLAGKEQIYIQQPEISNNALNSPGQTGSKEDVPESDQCPQRLGTACITKATEATSPQLYSQQLFSEQLYSDESFDFGLVDGHINSTVHEVRRSQSKGQEDLAGDADFEASYSLQPASNFEPHGSFVDRTVFASESYFNLNIAEINVETDTVEDRTEIHSAGNTNKAATPCISSTYHRMQADMEGIDFDSSFSALSSPDPLKPGAREANKAVVPEQDYLVSDRENLPNMGDSITMSMIENVLNEDNIFGDNNSAVINDLKDGQNRKCNAQETKGNACEKPDTRRKRKSNEMPSTCTSKSTTSNKVRRRSSEESRASMSPQNVSGGSDCVPPTPPDENANKVDSPRIQLRRTPARPGQGNERGAVQKGKGSTTPHATTRVRITVDKPHLQRNRLFSDIPSAESITKTSQVKTGSNSDSVKTGCTDAKDESSRASKENGLQTEGVNPPAKAPKENVFSIDNDDMFAVNEPDSISDDDDDEWLLRMTCSQSAAVTSTQGTFTIIDVCADQKLFNTFLKEWRSKSRFSICVACEQKPPPPVTPGTGIGGNYLKGTVQPTAGAVRQKVNGLEVKGSDLVIVGLAVCWENRDAYYISLTDSGEQCDPDDSLAPPPSDSRITVSNRLHGIQCVLDLCQGKQLSQPCVVTFDIKEQYQILAEGFGVTLKGDFQDPKVACWVLDPSTKEKPLHRLINNLLPSEVHLLEGLGGGIGVGSLGLTPRNPGCGRVRATVESVLTLHLMDQLLEGLRAQNLYRSFHTVEMPVVITLARMELNGMGFSEKECESQMSVMQAKLSAIEQEAYQLAGHPFSLTSTDDIIQVFYFELRLPPNGDPSSVSSSKTLGPNRRRGAVVRRGGKGKPQLSTSKEVLEKLKQFHALPGLLLEWRRISNALTKVVFPLQKEKIYCDRVDMYRIFGESSYHTATGRVTMSEPNLQNIPKDFEIQLPGIIGESPPTGMGAPRMPGLSRKGTKGMPYQKQTSRMMGNKSDSPFAISMRHAFVPFKGGVFLAADYSQLELRMLAHLSGDEKLARILNADTDVFKLIASQWKGLPVNQVSSEQRQQAKQVCYGMLYGIGPKALAEQLGVEEEDAAVFIETFKAKYIGMRTFIRETINKCRKNGYVETLLNRKRYLPAINDTNPHSRAHAERQAVNTTVQGSAADLVKSAMIQIEESFMKSFPDSVYTHRHAGNLGLSRDRRKPGLCGAYLVLQLHDELIYEASEENFQQIASLVKYHMENAIKLSVKLPVKVKVGKSWGKLEEYEIC